MSEPDSLPFSILKIGVPQLDIARIGSIWKGRRYTGKNWDQYAVPIEKQLFEFNFSTSIIESIDFFSKNSQDSFSYYIPYHKYNLQSIPNDNDYKVHFRNSKITRLTSSNDDVVLIPALELLTSAYTPKGQDIRLDLLSYPVNEVLRRHINLEKSKGVEGETYKIFLEKERHSSNSIFLAYLFCNVESQRRVSKLWASLAIGTNGGAKFPEVFPYHPSNLKVSVEGIRLSDNCFLVFRINKISLPTENKIEVDREKMNMINDDKLNNPSMYRSSTVVDSDLPVTSEVDPSTNAGVAYITSDVNFFPEQPSVSIIEVSADYENNTISQRIRPDMPTALSSGQKNSSIESKNTAELQQSEIETKEPEEIPIESAQNIYLIQQVLRDLISDVSSPVSSVNYIDENVNLLDTLTLAIFPKDLFNTQGISKWSAIYTESWKDKEGKIRYTFTPRKLLIVKITLVNGEYAYLLEIEKKSSEKGFSGLIFNVSDAELSKENLFKLLEEIAKNKGKFRRRGHGNLIDIELSTKDQYIYDHSPIQNSMLKKMNKVIQSAVENSVFKP